MREIKRVRRWPVQAITYKYGAWEIMQMKQKEEKLEGSQFSITNFHDKILNNGPLPFSILEEIFKM